MPFSLPAPDALQVALTVSTLAGIWVAWAKVIGPRVKRGWGKAVGAFQTVAGRDPIIDKVTGKEVSPAVPPLGEQLAAVNDTMGELVKVIQSNQDAHHRIDVVVTHQQVQDARMDDHDSTLAALIASKFESGARDALLSVEKANKDVIDVDPEP